MTQSTVPPLTALSRYELSTLREGEFTVYRGSGNRLPPILVVTPAAEHPSPAALKRLEHEYALRAELDRGWAAQPLALTHHNNRPALVLDDPGGEPLDRLLSHPLDTTLFLRIGISLAAAVRHVHQRNLIHKDIKPANVLVDMTNGAAWLTGFGIASRLPREHQVPQPPEMIAGTLAYMAPEQTGRMNRSIYSRSDLYALGMTLYEMLTGSLPFTAADPMGWMHCHIARQPVPPSERVPTVSTQVSSIIMKLVAKTAEDRYQTAAGVLADLQRCLTDWETQRRIDPFPLGAHDASDRLMIPERLYGRKAEIGTLRTSFERVVSGGMSELVLVSGYSGIGKSCLVNELHKALVPPRGLFAAGKFDQYKRNIPYATLAQACRSLVHRILGMSDAEMSQWRAALLEALGPNGQLMVNLIPELALIIGEQPEAPELPPQDQQARFQLVFRRFLGVFARHEHPLALFIDDLQWLDSATLDLIEHLVLHPEVRHLLLIGAYRDNEVSPTHPLARMLARLRDAGGRVQEILLTPLKPEDVERLLADALYAERGRVQPLADLVFNKTAGNPFFTIQFLSALAEEALLTFDPDKAAWAWNLPRIRAKGFTDNVADLMATKLSRLPPTTQKVLGRLACLGNVTDTATLTLVHEASDEAIHAALWEAVRAGLVLRTDGTYAFLHDRIQEAAYALIAEDDRAMAHLRIGRLLAARTATERLEENIFDIVNQFDRGAALINTAREREQVAMFNLMAGKRAKAETAYAAALQYFATGRALLSGENGGGQCYQLKFELELNWGECEYLTGELAAAEERLSLLSTRARTIVDAAAVTCVRINLYTTLDRSDRAVEVALAYLRRVDVRWPQHATAEDVQQEYGRLRQRLESASIEGLLDLPLMTDPDRRATMDVLTVLTSPALFTDSNLFRLSVGRMATLSLEHGNTDGSSLAYAWLGGVFGTHFGDYQAGFCFGRLGLDLVEKRGLDRFRARVYLVFAVHVAHWTQPLATSRALLRRAFEAAQAAGDLSYAAYSCIDLTANLFASGDPLDEVEREAENGLEFAQKVWFGLASANLTGQLRLIRMLRGLTADFGSFNDATFDESRFVRRLENNPQLALSACWYWIRKLQAGVYVGDSVLAITAATKVAPVLWTAPTQLEQSEYQFYGALARAAACDEASAEERSQHLAALADHNKLIAVWAKNCPATFGNRAALVGAEIARLQGRELDAEHLYEEAIRLARDNGFVQNEGLANELAARFYAARGFKTIADAYLRNARHCYFRWGAAGKVRQLDETYPQLREEKQPRGPTSAIGAPVEHLDLATVINVSQAVSSEIVLGKLLDTLMRTAIEQAGAERGLLMLPRGADLRIAAEARTGGDAVTVQLRDETVTAAVLPESVLHYALHTQEIVILDDASAQDPFSADPYICHHQARSILCVPLINQAKLIGVLYLENNLSSRAFVPTRIAVLKLVASQAAISLENARLYRDLKEREAKIRRLVDSNIIGIFMWDFEGQILEANEAFLHMVGYDHVELVAGRIRWTDLTPPDWRDRDARWVQEHKATGTLPPIEKEYFRKDGSRVPVLIGVAIFEEIGNQGVAFVLDLTERKRAEEALRDSEEALRRNEAWLTEAQRLSHTGTWVLNPTTMQYIYWSDESYRIWGFDPLQGLPSRDALWERIQDRDRVWEKVQEALRQKKDYSGEFTIVLPNGTVKYLAATSHHLFSTNGEIVQVIGTNVDVTERKRAEEGLRDSEAKFRDYAETASDWFCEMGPDYKFTLLSENAFGSGAADRIGTACWDHALDLETEPEKWRLLQETVFSRKPFRDFVYRGLSGNGSPMYVRTSGKPLFDANGEFRGYRGTCSDVTEITRAQEALRESERSARSAIDGIAGLVAVLAPNGELETVNRQLFEYSGRSLEYLKNWGTNDVVHPENLPRALELFKRGIASGNPFNFEVRIRRFDGEYRWFNNHGVPIRDDSGRIARWYVLLTDIEDRTQALARLEQMQSDFAHMNRVSMMGELAASLSHEITQPIASARNNARAAQNFLNMQPPDLSEIREALSCIVGDSDRAGDIVDRIRDHIKKSPPRKEHFDLNEAINEVIVLGRSAITKNGVWVQTRLSEGLFPVHGDRVQLQQVVLNLLLNAVEAMGSVEAAPRELLISTKQDHTGVLVAVRDSGPGIHPAHLERIFKSFYTTKPRGTGMGLSICRSIIDAHGGRLWAEANEPRGAVFQFTLPAVQVGS